jgi:hypothetical protein
VGVCTRALLRAVAMKVKIGQLLEHYFVAASRDERAEPIVELTIESIRASMRAGMPPADRSFDLHMSEELRSVSGTYWSPLVVAMRAAEWLDELGIETAVDIGSGAGKFCVAAALAGRGRFIGLEHRPRLVAAARALADHFGVADRVTFVEDTLGEGPIPTAEAYYLYNPFGENQFWYGERLDDDVELSEDRFARDVAATEALFREVPLGTCVITYNGFGGRMPADFEAVRVDRTLPNMLRLWRKTDVLRSGPSPLDGD